MPYTVEDFRREYVKEHLDDLTPEERLEGLPPEERLKGLSLRQRLAGIVPDEILSSLSDEALRRLVIRSEPKTEEERPPSSNENR